LGADIDFLKKKNAILEADQVSM